MVKYRRRFDIIADIISAAEKGAKKTKIMYFANLSYSLLTKYLSDTVKAGFICQRNERYESTEKGRIFLEKHSDFSSRYSKLMNEFEALKFDMEVLERMCTSIGDDETKSNNARRKLSEVL
jgi:predicted transcriptional regulator